VQMCVLSYVCGERCINAKDVVRFGLFHIYYLNNK